MKHFSHSFPLFTAAMLVSLPAGAQSISATNTIFLVDESSSMSGEHAFIDDFVLDLDPALSVNGISTRRYGLVGFGSSVGVGAANISEFTVGGGQLGSAADFDVAADGLVLSGGTEDGYAAIDYALDNFTLPAGSTTFVLITDEDRDDTDGTLTFASIQSSINSAGVNLVTILDVDIEDTDGNPAISTDGTTALVQDGTTFVSQPFGGTPSGAGTTVADYADLALATPNGCVADLNQLRAGGDAATAFAAAFQTCIIDAATNPIISNLLTNPYRDVGIFSGLSLRQQLRAMAYWMGYDGPANPGAATQDADGIAQDMFDVEGLRGYLLATGQTGSTDAVGGSAAVDYSGGGLTLGADMTVPVDTAGGLARYGAALSFQNTTADADTADVDTRGALLQVYGIYRTGGGLQFSGDVQIGQFDHDTETNAGVTGNGDGDLFSVSLEAGQRYVVPQGVLMPYAGLQRDRYEFSGFTDSASNTVPGYTETITRGKLGVRFETQTVTAAGALDAAVDLAVNSVINSTIGSDDPNTVAALDTLDGTRVDLGVDLGLTLENGGRVYMQLAGSSSDNSRSGTIGLGYQMRF